MHLILIFCLVFGFANLRAVAEEHEDPSALTLIPKLSLLTPNTILLSNNNFNVPSNKNIQGIPLINILMSKHWFTFEHLDVALQGGVGYGFRQQMVNLQANGTSTNNLMGLHLFPFSASLKGVYNIPRFPGVRPGLELGGGIYWLLHGASSLTSDQGFWLPFIRISPSLTFFESSYEKGDWWGGFCFGVSYQSSVAGGGNVSGLVLRFKYQHSSVITAV